MNRISSLIMLTWNALENIKLTLESLYSSSNNFWLIVVDNGSEPDVIDFLFEFSKSNNNIQLILNKSNIGVWRARQLALNRIDTKIVGTIDSDLIFPVEWLQTLEKSLIENNLGQVGPLKTSSGIEYPFTVGMSMKKAWNSCKSEFISPSMQLEHFLNGLEFNDFANLVVRHNQNLDDEFIIPTRSISGCAMLTLRDLYLDPRLNDPTYSKSFYGLEDIDYSWSLHKNGYGIKKVRDIYVHHFEHSSINANSKKIRDFSIENTAYFSEKWREEITCWFIGELNKGIPRHKILKNELLQILQSTSLYENLETL